MALMITVKKMPRAFRLGANPPFQRVEETNSACLKTGLRVILREFCCNATKLLKGIAETDQNFHFDLTN
jgi:hypothetical protein